MKHKDFGNKQKEDMMKIRDKEYQSLGMKQLKQLVDDYPNDMELGKVIRQIYWKTRATTNNPEGTSVTSPNSDLDSQMEEAHSILEDENRFPGNKKKDYTVHGYDANGSPVEEEIDTTTAYTTNPHPRPLT